MADYKVIQDIEAEDKLVGPLTLRQFIYAAIAALCTYLSFLALTKGFSLALVVLLPPAIFAGFFAFPWGRDQSTEVWALAKIRYYLKSRRRLWDQSGMRDLVTITAPRHEAGAQTNGLSQHEVRSRLSALATTLDTRGWAIKNVTNVPPLMNKGTGERLLDIGALPQEVPSIDVRADEDILDEDNNPRAQQLQQMVTAATATHKQQLLAEMRQGTMPTLPAPKGAAADYWYVPAAAPLAMNGEATLADALHHRELQAEAASPTEHLKTIEPLAPVRTASPQPTTAQPAATSAVPRPLDPATMRLANNNDLNIATIAREANKAKGSGEVVISLRSRKS